MMECSHKQGLPFRPKQVSYLILQIAYHMIDLHRQHSPILYNDLKAVNVFVYIDEIIDGPYLDDDGIYIVFGDDYECLVGVMCTSLWRVL